MDCQILLLAMLTMMKVQNVKNLIESELRGLGKYGKLRRKDQHVYFRGDGLSAP